MKRFLEYYVCIHLRSVCGPTFVDMVILLMSWVDTPWRLWWCYRIIDKHSCTRIEYVWEAIAWLLNKDEDPDYICHVGIWYILCRYIVDIWCTLCEYRTYIWYILCGYMLSICTMWVHDVFYVDTCWLYDVYYDGSMWGLDVNHVGTWWVMLCSCGSHVIYMSCHLGPKCKCIVMLLWKVAPCKLCESCKNRESLLSFVSPHIFYCLSWSRTWRRWRVEIRVSSWVMFKGFSYEESSWCSCMPSATPWRSYSWR